MSVPIPPDRIREAEEVFGLEPGSLRPQPNESLRVDVGSMWFVLDYGSDDRAWFPLNKWAADIYIKTAECADTGYYFQSGAHDRLRDAILESREAALLWSKNIVDATAWLEVM